MSPLQGKYSEDVSGYEEMESPFAESLLRAGGHLVLTRDRGRTGIPGSPGLHKCHLGEVMTLFSLLEFYSFIQRPSLFCHLLQSKSSCC